MKVTITLVFFCLNTLAAQSNLTVEWMYGPEADRLTSVPDHLWLQDNLLGVHDRFATAGWYVFNPVSKRKETWFDEKKALVSLFECVPDIKLTELPWPEDITCDGRRMAFCVKGEIVVLDTKGPIFRCLGRTATEEKCPRFSPDGNRLAFVRSNDLYVFDFSTSSERRLTTDGNQTTLNGTLSWLYWEEIFDRKDIGYWWSDDSKSIAYLQTNESMVSVVRWIDFKPAVPAEILQRYPKTGSVNPVVRVGVVSADGGETRWMKTDIPGNEYTGRVRWTPDGRLSIQVLDRAQTASVLLLADVRTGICKTVLIEKDPGWVSFHDDMIFLGDGKSFLWTSERTGFNHIYRSTLDGRVSPITEGNWSVRPSSGPQGGIVHVDEKGGWIYFTSMEKASTERHLYRIGFNGRKKEKISNERGVHSVLFSPDGKYYADEFSNNSTLPALSVYERDGKKIVTLSSDRQAALATLGVQSPELFHIPASDGFMLPAQIMKPPAFDSTKKYPLIIYVYGGPSAPSVLDKWNRDQWYNQILLDKGFLVAKVDNRSATAISKTLENTVVRLQASDHELNDLVDAVHWLKKQPYIDSSRVGVWGWSGGGTFTLLAMSRSTEFKAGISVAPVTDWHYYDTKYGEATMKTPLDNPEGYQKTSLPQYAKDLHGRLLLVQGTYDDNVHPQNVWHFADELIKANVQFDMMIYPMRKHGIEDKPARIHLYNKMVEFWMDHLAN